MLAAILDDYVKNMGWAPEVSWHVWDRPPEGLETCAHDGYLLKKTLNAYCCNGQHWNSTSARNQRNHASLQQNWSPCILHQMQCQNQQRGPTLRCPQCQSQQLQIHSTASTSKLPASSRGQSGNSSWLISKSQWQVVFWNWQNPAQLSIQTHQQNAAHLHIWHLYLE